MMAVWLGFTAVFTGLALWLARGRARWLIVLVPAAFVGWIVILKARYGPGPLFGTSYAPEIAVTDLWGGWLWVPVTLALLGLRRARTTR